MTADDLTSSQRAAVEHQDGPLLVLAGPGSGKTRVITRRIARLVERGAWPSEILAITFTNKAAREMAERVTRLMPGERVWVSTFHRFCASLLRRYGDAVGLRPNFTIYDTSDQTSLLRQLLHDVDVDGQHFPPAKLAHQISQAKNDLLTAEMYARTYEERIGTHLQAVVARVYPLYQARLLAANAVDFDDLLLHVVRLLQENEELRADLDQRYRYILVDEYQDTNSAQYQIVAALSQNVQNLCATGDPDQSIYGWRGAQIENILRFERDYPNVQVIRLEDNFRSTPEILRTADCLIAHNQRRKHKQLRTENASGPPVEMRLYPHGQIEANAIADEIRDLVAAGERQWADFAIFYRVNAMSRSLETAMRRVRVPYQVAGGISFFERSEVKDLVAYLRLIDNPSDRIAFLRAVNTPVRGIGKSSVEKLNRWAEEQQLPLLTAAEQAKRIPKLPKRAGQALEQFAHLIRDLSAYAIGPVADLLERVIQATGYHIATESQGTSEAELQRKSIVQELIGAAKHYDEQSGDEASLGGFLETISLVQDVDGLDTDLGAVTLMTLHAAKGLEFPCVYIVGVEQNLIPHERSMRSNDERELEEERRLLFVGITRAQQQLVLTHTQRRTTHGRDLHTIPSMFLEEMPLEHRDFTQTNVESFSFTGFADDDEPVARTPSASTSAASATPASSTTAFTSRKPKLPKRSLEDLLGTPLLTTAAALEQGSDAPAALPFGFETGMTVRHPRYGLGTVVDVTTGYARRRTVTVDFVDDNRRESFIADKCPLQPVGTRRHDG